jgi:3-dehydroquinate dehydratase-1
MKYKTCVSVAETTPARTKKKLKIALLKSDFVEIRFDFLKKEQVPETLEMIKKDLNRIVCTLRPKTEGGKFSGNEKERVAILKLIAEYNPFLLDVEFNTLKKNSDLQNTSNQQRQNYLFHGTISKRHQNQQISERKLIK